MENESGHGFFEVDSRLFGRQGADLGKHVATVV
jgi:hypothetical protein